MEVPPSTLPRLKGGGIVEGPGEEAEAVVGIAEDVARGGDEEDGDHHAHADRQAGVDASRWS